MKPGARVILSLLILLAVAFGALTVKNSWIRSTQVANPTFSPSPDDPNDETVAFMHFEDGKQTIFTGKLHSHHFQKLCYGVNPIVSESGDCVAYTPLSDSTDTNPTSKQTEVIFVQTRKVIPLTAVPQSVIFPTTELNARQSIEGRLSIENHEYYGALFFHPPNAEPFRLTPEKMFVNSTPIWIARTGEALFIGTYDTTGFLKTFFFGHDPDDFDSGPDEVYLVKPESRDWANASKADWQNAVIVQGEQVSCSD